MRLIVTGAAGVLGSELIEQTLRADPQAEIVAVTRQPQALTQRWQGYANMKCCSWDELAQMPLADGDVIVHGAFPRKENGQELTEALEILTYRHTGGAASTAQAVEVWPELAAVVEITVTRETGGAAHTDQALEVWPELTEQIEATTELDRSGGTAASQVVEIYPEGGG